MQEQMARSSYAGFWIRFVAVLLDGLVLSLILFLLGGQSIDMANPELGNLWLSPVIGLLYYVGLTTWKGQTLGKMALGIRVQPSQGGTQNRFLFILIRETIGKWLSALIFAIGYIMVGFTDRKQALHDFIGGTVVVKVERKPVNME